MQKCEVSRLCRIREAKEVIDSGDENEGEKEKEELCIDGADRRTHLTGLELGKLVFQKDQDYHVKENDY